MWGGGQIPERTCLFVFLLKSEHHWGEGSTAGTRCEHIDSKSFLVRFEGFEREIFVAVRVRPLVLREVWKDFGG